MIFDIILILALVGAICLSAICLSLRDHGRFERAIQTLGAENETLRKDIAESDAWVDEHRHILDAHDPTRRHTDQDVGNLFARTRTAMHAHWRRDEPAKPKQTPDLVWGDDGRLVMDAPENAEYLRAAFAYQAAYAAWSERVEAEKAAFLPYDDAVTNIYLAWRAERPAPEAPPEPALNPAATQQALDMVHAQLKGDDYASDEMPSEESGLNALDSPVTVVSV